MAKPGCPERVCVGFGSVEEGDGEESCVPSSRPPWSGPLPRAHLARPRTHMLYSLTKDESRRPRGNHPVGMHSGEWGGRGTGHQQRSLFLVGLKESLLSLLVLVTCLSSDREYI